MDTTQSGKETITKVARTRKRSVYLFPAYDFSFAKQIAEKVERDGAGNLSEETLAIGMRLSAKSSGFQLKTLTARQFGLLSKSGQTLSTTPIAKAILKPVNEAEKKNAMIQSFLAIPLFREVATRFKGRPLPASQDFRNILEREFSIDSKRVSDAERVLIDSARDTGTLITKGDTKYISTDISAFEKSEAVPPAQEEIDQSAQDAKPKSSESQRQPRMEDNILPIIGEEDLLLLDKEKFKSFWDAYGDIIRARAERSQKLKGTSNQEIGDKKS